MQFTIEYSIYIPSGDLDCICSPMLWVHEIMEQHSISLVCQHLACFAAVIKILEDTSLTKSAHVMKVLLSSYYFLSTWISFCWANHVAEEKYPLFKKYQLALDPRDLIHISLDDAQALQALKCVCKFLLACEQRVWIPFRTNADTLVLALEYGLASNEMNCLYSEQLTAAETAIETQWKDISRHQQELNVLDRDLMLAQQKQSQET